MSSARDNHRSFAAPTLPRARRLVGGFLPLLLCITGCDRGTVSGRIVLPDSEHGGPTVPPEEVCSKVSVVLGVYIETTSQYQQFELVIPQFQKLAGREPVGGTFDPATRSCTYAIEHDKGDYVLHAGYDLANGSWDPPERYLYINSGQVPVTITGGSTTTRDIQLKVETRPR